MVGNIIVGVLLILAVFALFRSYQFGRDNPVGPDAVAAYAASVVAKEMAAGFIILAALIAFFQWLI